MRRHSETLIRTARDQPLLFLLRICATPDAQEEPPIDTELSQLSRDPAETNVRETNTAREEGRPADSRSRRDHTKEGKWATKMYPCTCRSAPGAVWSGREAAALLYARLRGAGTLLQAAQERLDAYEADNEADEAAAAGSDDDDFVIAGQDDEDGDEGAHKAPTRTQSRSACRSVSTASRSPLHRWQQQTHRPRIVGSCVLSAEVEVSGKRKKKKSSGTSAQKRKLRASTVGTQQPAQQRVPRSFQRLLEEVCRRHRPCIAVSHGHKHTDTCIRDAQGASLHSPSAASGFLHRVCMRACVCVSPQAGLDKLPPGTPSYLTAAVGPPQTSAPRKFCSVCGNMSS